MLGFASAVFGLTLWCVTGLLVRWPFTEGYLVHYTLLTISSIIVALIVYRGLVASSTDRPYTYSQVKRDTAPRKSLSREALTALDRLSREVNEHVYSYDYDPVYEELVSCGYVERGGLIINGYMGASAEAMRVYRLTNSGRNAVAYINAPAWKD